MSWALNRPQTAEMSARIDAEWTLTHAKKRARRIAKATSDRAETPIAPTLVCPICAATHWRPDLYSRCVRCELKARRSRSSGHGVPAGPPSVSETAAAGRSSSPSRSAS